MKTELLINKESLNYTQETCDAISEAITKLSTTSQEQFESIKKEKWYNRVFDMVTFSQKGKKRLAEQIGTVAQAQDILFEILVRISNDNVNISEIVRKSMEDIKKIKEQEIYLLDRSNRLNEKYNRLENILLGIKPDRDINSLSEMEKDVLSACLYLLCEKNADASDAQKKYADNLLNYLQNRNTKMENPFIAIDDMDNNTKKNILSCCMEYLFLKDFDEKSMDDEFVDEFDLGNKTIKQLKQEIIQLYNLRGEQGFYSKYQTDNFLEMDDFFYVDIDETDECFEEVDDDQPKEMQDEIITSILQISHGETRIYKNKNIHISSFIKCEGEIIFDHCNIYYNESDSSDEITLEDSACITIKNSTVYCKGFDSNYFITCKKNNTIFIENSNFIDSTYFITSINAKEFVLCNCFLKNCIFAFAGIYAIGEGKCEIYDNKFIEEEISDFNLCNLIKKQKDSNTYLDYGVSFSYTAENVITAQSADEAGNEIKINYWNNSYEKKEDLKNVLKENKIETCFMNFEGEVKNSTFIGLTNGIKVASVNESKFENCEKIISFTINSNDLFEIDNCIFINCSNIASSINRGLKISNSQFISCYDNLFVVSAKYGIEIEFCEFHNLKQKKDDYIASIVLHNPGSSICISHIRKCIFDGINYDDLQLVKASSLKKPTCYIAKVEDCDFKNIHREQNNKIIEECIKYDTLLKKDQLFRAIIIENCKGLDNINKQGKESGDFNIWEKAKSGNMIGAVL